MTIDLSWKSLIALSGRETFQPIIDAVLCTSMIIHSHIGFDSCLIDYVHERKFPVLGVIGKWTLRAATGLSIWGVYEFETNDIGELYFFLLIKIFY